MPSRREFLVSALAFVAAACTGGNGRGKQSIGSSPPTGHPSIAELTSGVPELSVLGLGPGALGGDPKEPIQTGNTIVTFDVSTNSGLLEGGTPLLYAAQSEHSPAGGPFRGTWTPFTGYDKTGDHSPRSPIPGVYVAQIEIPQPGLYVMAATGPQGPKQGVGITHVYFSAHPQHAVGSKATRVQTPVAKTAHQLREVCTRRPPDPMHYISLSDALGNGKPTIAVFSTPLLCQSQLCGPVTDEVLLVYEQVGKSRANFIHVEEFLPGPDLKPDASKLSPGFRAWGLETEPWVFVIDKKGIIRARYQGPATAPMIAAALQPLL
jgi:hypothetical protein